LQIRTPNESIARTAWTMGGATETRAECEVTIVETVREEQEWATTRAKELQSKKALGRRDSPEPPEWRDPHHQGDAHRETGRVLAGRRRSSRVNAVNEVE
jgi:hypothetical protein